MQIKSLLTASVVLRALLLAYGELQDNFSAVKYTDIDYHVFTDAARYVTNGQSPFLRSTYRYSPLLAYMLVPNILVTRIWGKILFAGVDIVAAWQIWRIGQTQHVSQQRCFWSVIAWLYNPFTITISTRGSCDSLVTVMLLAVLLLLLKSQTTLSAVVYGLAVHFRIYPIVYAPAIVLYLAHRQQNPNSNMKPYQRAANWVKLVLQQGACFGSISGGVFMLLGLLFYQLYGDQFLHEAFLHHLSRKDPRHNFSVYYYPVYLDLMSWPGTAAADRVGQVIVPYTSTGGDTGLSGCSGNSTMVSYLQQAAVTVRTLLLPQQSVIQELSQSLARLIRAMPVVQVSTFAAVPQALLLLVFAATLHKNLPLCWLLQTMAFVAFNKVSTAQYFVWYFSLLPVVLQDIHWPLSKGLVTACVAWLVTQLHWLGWAYLLEFQSMNVHLMLWFAGILFLLAHTCVMWTLLDCSQLLPQVKHVESGSAG